MARKLKALFTISVSSCWPASGQLGLPRLSPRTLPAYKAQQVSAQTACLTSRPGSTYRGQRHQVEVRELGVHHLGKAAHGTESGQRQPSLLAFQPPQPSSSSLVDSLQPVPVRWLALLLSVRNRLHAHHHCLRRHQALCHTLCHHAIKERDEDGTLVLRCHGRLLP